VINDDNPSQAIEGHKTRVASIAACNDITAQNYDGVARGASLLDVGDGTTVGSMITSLEWAISSTLYKRVQ